MRRNRKQLKLLSGMKNLSFKVSVYEILHLTLCVDIFATPQRLGCSMNSVLYWWWFRLLLLSGLAYPFLHCSPIPSKPSN
jgi:hypothetical protein